MRLVYQYRWRYCLILTMVIWLFGFFYLKPVIISCYSLKEKLAQQVLLTQTLQSYHRQSKSPALVIHNQHSSSQILLKLVKLTHEYGLDFKSSEWLPTTTPQELHLHLVLLGNQYAQFIDFLTALNDESLPIIINDFALSTDDEISDHYRFECHLLIFKAMLSQKHSHEKILGHLPK